MMIKQLDIKNPKIQAYETYVITNDDFGKSAPVYVYMPISQEYGKNSRWISYSTTTKTFGTFYYTAKELENAIKKSSYPESKLKLYVISLDWGEALPFKLMNESELQSQLVAATTMQGHRTRAPAKKVPVKVNFKKML